MDKPSKKSSPFSKEQKSAMVEYMERHPQLISGKFDSDFTYKKASSLWEEITLMLNAIPGAKKDWKNWRKIWHDMRSRIKGKQAKINRYTRGTGGGPAFDDQLDSTESKVVALIGNTAISGHREITESQVLFINYASSGSHNKMLTQEETGINKKYYIDLKSPTPLDSNNINEHNGEMPNEDLPAEKSPIINMNNSTTQKNTAKEVSTDKVPTKRRMATQRLNRTVTATEKLAAQCELKNKTKKEYYDKKINLIKRELIIKERIAKALETIASNMK